MDNINLEIVRESFGRVVYSHKIHEKEADIKNKRVKIIKILNIIFTILTSTSLVSVLITKQELLNYVAAFLSSIALGIAIYQLSFNFEKEIQEHKFTAIKLWKIREDYIALIADITNEAIKYDEIIKRRDELTERLENAYKSAPPTTYEAYKMAQKGLKVDEELTFSAKEIDVFLPSALRIEK